MLSTFFGLTIAQSGLNSFHVALNTTANNISNVRTPGYCKQQANRVASSALRTYTSYGAVGTGVKTESVTQLRNLYYDHRYWENQTSLGLYESRLNYFHQIENYFIDTGEEGFSTIMDKMFANLDTLKTNAGDVNTRQQFTSSAHDFAVYFNSVAQGLSDIQGNVNEEIKSTVDNINAIAQKISLLNKQINVIEVQGGYANELRDQRALLVDELSKIVPVEATEAPVENSKYPDMYTGGTHYTVRINGQILVNDYDYNQLECVSRERKINQSDVDGLYSIKWKDTGNTFYAGGNSMSGTLKALFDIRDGNNADNFTGVVKIDNSRQITVTSPSVTSVETMTMPQQGVLTINGRDYKYDGFTFETNDKGEVTSYTFNLDAPLSSQDIEKADGKSASIGSAVDVMGIPYYMAQMNQFLRSFTQKFNDIMKKGEDLNGDPTDYFAFFTAADKDGNEYAFGDKPTGSTDDCYYQLTAANIKISSVCATHPDKIGLTVHPESIDDNKHEIESGGVDSYDLCEELLKLHENTTLYRGGNAADFLKCMIADISVDKQESEIFYEKYYNVGSTIESQRMSISGVDEDEEGLDMLKFQYSYNLASKMISVMAEIYDKLIQQTGV